MARKTQESRLADFRDRIDQAKRARDHDDMPATWKRMIDLYRGKHWGDTGIDQDDDLVVVNLCFAIANVVQSAVTTQYPKFTVSPNKVGYDDQGVIAEAVLNYYWRHYDFHDQFRLAVKDFVVLGHGWLKVGWRYAEHTETVQPDSEELAVELEQANAQMDEVAMAPVGPDAGELPTPEELAETQPTGPREEIVVDSDDPFVERVSPFDVYVDPEATLPSNLRWLAHRVVRTLDEVKADTMYDSRARNRVEADLSIMDDDTSRRTTELQDTERVTVWEFYDVADKTWCVFAAGGDSFLRKPEPIPYAYGHPFVMFRNYEIPDRFYPMGELEQIEPLQEEINKTRTQAVDARKNFIRKFLSRTHALDDRAKRALMSDRDGEIVLVDDDNAPFDQIISAAPSLTFDPNTYNVHSDQVQRDLQTVTGLSDYQFGQMPDTRRLATEASIVETATNARSSFKLAMIERTLAIVGRYLLQVTQQFLEGTRAARINGPGGEMLFEYDDKDIAGEFDLEVEAGSTQPKNDMLRRQEALALFNTLAPFMGTVIDPTEAIKYLLSTAYDMPNVDRFFIPPAPPGMAPPGQAPPAGPGGPPPEGGGEMAPAPPESNVVPIAG